MPDAFRRLFILLQVLLAGAAVVLISYLVLRPAVPVKHDPQNWRSWNGFYVLSYQGITKDGEAPYIDRRRLEDQLRALQGAGFQTVTAEDVLAFLEGRRPLPDKALLILFEGGRTDSYLYATPLLRKFGMMASMCVPTDVTDSWSSFYLSSGSLRKLSGQPNWQLCSMGNAAVKKIPVDGSGKEGHFLTSRLWSSRGVEDDASYQRRVAADYADSAHILKKAAGKPALLYLYPFADTGAGEGDDPLVERTNRKAVSSHYRLAVRSADNPYNDRKTDPFYLNRLRVQSDWTGNALVQVLARYTPREEVPAGAGDRSSWLEKGRVTMQGGHALLAPGSSLWVRGSDDWSDLDVTALLGLEGGGAATLFVRYRDSGSYLRLAADEGEIFLSESLGGVSQTLFRIRLHPGGNAGQKIRLRVKGNRAWIWHDNILVGEKIPVPALLVRGRVGVSAGRGIVKLLDFTASQVPELYVFTGSYDQLSPPQQQSAKAVLFPMWRAGSSPALHREDLLKAASSGVAMIPVLGNGKDQDLPSAEQFVDNLKASLGRDAVCSLVTRVAIRGTGDNELADHLKKKGFGIIRIVTPEQAKAMAERRGLPEKEVLLIDGPGKEAREALGDVLHNLPPDSLIIRLDGMSGVPAGVGIAFYQGGEEK